MKTTISVVIAAALCVTAWAVGYGIGVSGEPEATTSYPSALQTQLPRGDSDLYIETNAGGHYGNIDRDRDGIPDWMQGTL